MYGDGTTGPDLFIRVETVCTGFVSMEEIETMPLLYVRSKHRICEFRSGSQQTGSLLMPQSWTWFLFQVLEMNLWLQLSIVW